jgi:uncharacterized membrane protein YdjX (TVP38/TMEM64 family)
VFFAVRFYSMCIRLCPLFPLAFTVLVASLSSVYAAAVVYVCIAD